MLALARPCSFARRTSSAVAFSITQAPGSRSHFHANVPPRSETTCQLPDSASMPFSIRSRYAGMNAKPWVR
jgi:hypothetical protein